MIALARPLCGHCKTRFVNRPRGLCWACYYTPGVKDRFVPTSKYARRGVGNFNGTAPLPAEPTDAEPGSAEKVAVLERRAALGVSLWHPADPRIVRQKRRPTAPTPETVIGVATALLTIHEQNVEDLSPAQHGVRWIAPTTQAEGASP